MSSREDLRLEVQETLAMARAGQGDWLATIGDTADDLAAAGFTELANRLDHALAVARSGGHGDWLVMIEDVADDLG